MTFPFAAKSYTQWKSQFNEVKRTFSCLFGFTFTVKVRLSCLHDLFWKLQFNENENNFQLSFRVCFHTCFWKSKLNPHEKVFQRDLQSKSKSLPFWWSVLKVAIQWNEKNFQPSFWLCLPNTSSTAFRDRFWKSQFNENEKDFQRHFGLFSKEKQAVPLWLIYFESRKSMKSKGLSPVSLVLMIFFQKLQFNENEKNFRYYHFGFAITPFSESHNSIKMKRTFSCHLDFVFTAQPSLALRDSFWKS